MNELTRGLRDSAEPHNDVIEDLTRRLMSRADAEGLVDVAYTVSDSPVGRLLLAASRRGLMRIAYPNESVDVTLAELALHVSPRIVELPARLDAARRQLDEYFAGKRKVFELPLDLTVAPAFQRAVLEATRKIGYGKTATYREVAASAGNDRAVRAAGTALGKNPIPIVVPCHRVVRTGGGLGGYTGGLDRKRVLLALEGVLGAG